ncbi:MAG TPA: polyhydroxyalkanoic acid system family protein [Xanthobacteraceae bacterium]|jgi:hypothetical protein|nr:polyhydroxyalkanoic acid system family protein [Xanthobacteraceae bacterium]
MAAPLIISIPHRLSKGEAVRQLQSGLAGIGSSFGNIISITQQTWAGDHLDFSVAVLGQTATGTIDVADDHVRLEVMLPWLIAQIASRFQPMIERQGTLMLEKK